MRKLIRLHAHDLHGGFDGTAQIGPGCQLHTAGEGQRIDVEVALAHHLLQVGWHHAGIKLIVGRGDRDDGRLQLGVNQDFVQLLTQQHGHGRGQFSVNHQQQGLLRLPTREKVQL